MKKVRNGKMQLIAHRGSTGRGIRENTLEAFTNSIQLGADMIETDVRMTKDGKLICSHDPDWNGKLIRKMTYAEWKNQTITYGWKPPLLTEVLTLCAEVIPLNIEMKEPGLEKVVIETLRKSFPLEDVILSSFEDNIITKVKKEEPAIQTGLVVGKSLFMKGAPGFSFQNDSYPDKRLKQTRADAVCPHYRIAKKDFISRLQKKGYPVYIWTVNKEDKMKELRSHGADGIFTDDIERARQAAQTSDGES
ncbi:glycerophosphodiester phosphodiesterase [Alteribacillus sp. HJP-4]|uniref:glycerophosphodiester phosphodiesterase n=1 Tax=Alteribacillus sp. HJP-4 TaxID=2775394 RepID=UPI0035CD3162